MFKFAFIAMLAANANAADLFNGRDFKGWELASTPSAPMSEALAMLPGGVVSSTGNPSGFFATTASYRNYRLHAEWRWSGKPGNAGILLHISPGPMDRVWPLSLQVQTKHGSAGDLLPMAGAAIAEPLTGTTVRLKARLGANTEKSEGEWNSCDILARDGVVEVSINGVPQNRASGVQPSSGRVGFQLEGAPYELRNVTLTPLD